MSNDQPKQCPFCETKYDDPCPTHGKDPLRTGGNKDEGYYVRCFNCWTAGPTKETLEQAIIAFNHRPAEDALKNKLFLKSARETLIEIVYMGMVQRIKELETAIEQAENWLESNIGSLKSRINIAIGKLAQARRPE